MRDTVHLLVDAGTARTVVTDAVAGCVARVARYVPGYRLKQAIQFREVPADAVAGLTGQADAGPALQVTVLLQVEGAAHYLPAYAGNLDIMTSAAVRTAELVAGARTGAAA